MGHVHSIEYRHPGVEGPALTYDDADQRHGRKSGASALACVLDGVDEAGVALRRVGLTDFEPALPCGLRS